VFVHASVLPAGTTSLKQGAKVEFGVVDGKRGKQALSVTGLEQPTSIVKAGRKPAEDVAIILEDLIKLMDSASNQLRRGRYPSDDHCRKLAVVMRAVADDFDV
jgi:CspA family cold shock protein